MDNIINDFKKSINNNPTFDMCFLEETILNLKTKLNELLEILDAKKIADLLESIGYTVSKINSSCLSVNKYKNIVFIFDERNPENIENSIILQANKDNVLKLVYEYVLDYLVEKYDVIWNYPNAYQKIKNTLYGRID